MSNRPKNGRAGRGRPSGNQQPTRIRPVKSEAPGTPTALPEYPEPENQPQANG
ncbi:hypothetical protein ACEZDB_07975 [Streptacidiphilus sp. N1-3]|uniref:23S rRNA pseudouridylate synthase B n=1 Tax=Streptacidiphilus alkalitolerans TaxID=3342712 RepID=A0ABV6WXZ0_9ACTN